MLYTKDININTVHETITMLKQSSTKIYKYLLAECLERDCKTDQYNSYNLIYI